MFIINFLEKYYKIKTHDYGFCVYNKLTDSVFFDNEKYGITFIDHFIEIFGDNIELRNIAISWFNDNRDKLNLNLVQYLSEMDLNIGSSMLEFKILNKFKDSIYNKKFIIYMFNSYYSEHKLEKIYENFIQTIDLKKNNKKTRSEILNLIGKLLNSENVDQRKKFVSRLNHWYTEKILLTKVNVFLTKCRIKLGDTNWEIYYNNKRISFSKFNKFVLNELKEDDSIEINTVNELIYRWYNDKLIEHTESQIKNDIKIN